MNPDFTVFADTQKRTPLDDHFYNLDGSALEFFKKEIGIDDEDELKKHILDIQARAYEIHGYPCIQILSFLKLVVSLLSFYPQVLQLARERTDAIFLDMGCLIGSDLRKVVADGWPADNVVGSDIKREFWDLGHELFRSSSTTFPATFVHGDAFDSNMIAPRLPFYADSGTPRPPLSTLTSLTPLQGHVSAIYAAGIFHLFDEIKQHELAQRLASLLSPKPGSVIFGCHAGMMTKGILIGKDYGYTMFCHSPESWKELWDGEVFQKGTVRVDAELVMNEKFKYPNEANTSYKLIAWCVTRL